MRKIVLQMMTTLDGRLDDPAAWVHGVSDDQYRAIGRIHAAFDTVLVGRTTYEEMAAYWPSALAEAAGTETNQGMARRMHGYRKLVFSRSGRQTLTEWNNTESGRWALMNQGRTAPWLATTRNTKQATDAQPPATLDGGTPCRNTLPM